MRRAFRFVGILCVAFGMLFFLQGAGVVHWPASSFMLDQRIWMVWGAVIALFGAMLMLWSRRR
ncbi:MAG: hypothetical protein J0I47_03110 [Sphingomonas sp.]|uniref:hypothetical protein n=1 Tax=Sphingomonas sp. TaxID=28214 RepID=UPI001AC9FEBE|nr:hypothetical protein [Sphingomonas sp.]MBN8807216.1 hypothetical protein [Sphingomonas sp.]